jgi:DNA-binding response OmpR family regulator
VSAESCKVLVIDDDASCAEELCLLLSAAGFPAQRALSAIDGLTRFLIDPSFCVVVSDIRMPDFNGFELSKLVRVSSARGATASLILMTGHLDEHPNTDVWELGVSTILWKPLDPNEVLHAVSKAFDLHSGAECRPEPIRQPEGPQAFRTRTADPLDEISLVDILTALGKIIREDNAT